MPVLNFDNVAGIQFVAVTRKPHTSFCCVQRVRWSAWVLGSRQSHPYGDNHFPSTFSSLASNKSGRVGKLCTCRTLLTVPYRTEPLSDAHDWRCTTFQGLKPVSDRRFNAIFLYADGIFRVHFAPYSPCCSSLRR